MSSPQFTVSEAYRKLVGSKKKYKILTGGRGSGKTFFAILYILAKICREPGHLVLYTRYTATSVKEMVELFENVIELLNWQSFFRVYVDRIVCLTTDSAVKFKGLKSGSKAQKANLKSEGEPTTLVVEEGEDFNDEVAFDKIDLSLRSKIVDIEVIWIQNPSTREHFIFKRFFEGYTVDKYIDGCRYQYTTHPDVEHVHTTYLDNYDNLNETYIEKLLSIRRTDKKKYEQIVIGSWLDRAEGAIFTNWRTYDFDKDPRYLELPKLFGQDYGYSNDPTTLVEVVIDKKHRRVYLKEKLYKPFLTTPQVATQNIIHSKGKLIIADSSEPRLIKELKQFKCNIKGVKKFDGSILTGIALMQDYELIVHPSSENLITELSNYVWMDNKSKPIDDYNHLIDAIRYVFMHALYKPNYGKSPV